ncbi:hypothetical protein ACPA9J_10385 [Pseudomonas aeruginosa]
MLQTHEVVAHLPRRWSRTRSTSSGAAPATTSSSPMARAWWWLIR